MKVTLCTSYFQRESAGDKLGHLLNLFYNFPTNMSLLDLAMRTLSAPVPNITSCKSGNNTRIRNQILRTS